LVEAPRAHGKTNLTRRYLHDCEYAGIGEIRAGMTEAARLKKKLYSHRIPFKIETINAPPLLPTKDAAPRPDSGKGKAALRTSPYNADQGPPNRRKLEDRESRALMNRTPLDYRLVNGINHHRGTRPRIVTSIVTEPFIRATAPARDRALHSGPMADNNFRDKYDSSFRDKSMSSDHSRDSRPREAAKETIGTL
jgi:hypothetical protein